jgi:type IV pilus assembly protein PilA
MVEQVQARRISSAFSRGFTLIELMIVVVIIGVLATLAVYGLSSYIQKSKLAEAREVVGGIMAAQEAYFDEVGAFLDVTGSPAADANYYPNGNFDGKKRIQWGADDGCTVGSETCQRRFSRLGVYVNSPVIFRYSSTVLPTGINPNTLMPSHVSTGAFNPSAVTAPRNGYVVVAMTDLDGNTSDRSVVVGSSLQAQLYIENAGY